MAALSRARQSGASSPCARQTQIEETIAPNASAMTFESAGLFMDTLHRLRRLQKAAGINQRTERVRAGGPKKEGWMGPAEKGIRRRRRSRRSGSHGGRREDSRASRSADRESRALQRRRASSAAR